MKIRLLFGLLLTCGSLWGQQPDIPKDATANELMNASFRAFMNSRFPEAIALLERAVELEPKHPRAWANLAAGYANIQEYDKAAGAARKQIEINPFHHHAYHILGMALAAQGSYAEAEKAFRKQLEINPLHKSANAELGLLLIRTERESDAATFLERAVSLPPNDYKVVYNYGLALERSGKPEEGARLKAEALAAMGLPPPLSPNTVDKWATKLDATLSPAAQETILTSRITELRESLLREKEALTRGLARSNQLIASWSQLGLSAAEQGKTSVARDHLMAVWWLSHSGEVAQATAGIYSNDKVEERRMYLLAATADIPVKNPTLRAKQYGKEPGWEKAVEERRRRVREDRDIQTRSVESNEKMKADVVVSLSREEGSEDVLIDGIWFFGGHPGLQAYKLAPKEKPFTEISFPGHQATRIFVKAFLGCNEGRCTVTLVDADYPQAEPTLEEKLKVAAGKNSKYNTEPPKK